MKTNELVKKVKANDNEAFKEILHQYRPMIYSFIQSNRLEHGDYLVNRDDLFQEGAIALHEACLLYDENNNASFHTFAHIVVQRKIKRVFIQNYRRYQHECYSIDAVREGMTYKNIASSKISDNPSLAYQAKEENIFLRKYYASLSDMEQQIVNLRRRNCSYKEISRKLNISEKTIDNQIQKIRRRFKKIKLLNEFENRD